MDFFESVRIMLSTAQLGSPRSVVVAYSMGNCAVAKQLFHEATQKVVTINPVS